MDYNKIEDRTLIILKWDLEKLKKEEVIEALRESIEDVVKNDKRMMEFKRRVRERAGLIKNAEETILTRQYQRKWTQIQEKKTSKTQLQKKQKEYHNKYYLI